MRSAKRKASIQSFWSPPWRRAAMDQAMESADWSIERTAVQGRELDAEAVQPRIQLGAQYAFEDHADRAASARRTTCRREPARPTSVKPWSA